MQANPQQNTAIVPYNTNTQLVPTQEQQTVQNNDIVPMLSGRVEQNVPLLTDNLIQQIAPNTYEKQKKQAQNKVEQNTEDREYKQLREDAETIVKEAIRKSYPHFSNRQVNNYFTRVTKGKYNKLQSQKIAEKIYDNITDKLDDKISGLEGLASFPELSYENKNNVDYEKVMSKALDILSGEYISPEEEWRSREIEKYEYYDSIINGIRERLNNSKSTDELFEIYDNAENELPLELNTEETFNILIGDVVRNAERIEQDTNQRRTQENAIRSYEQISKFDFRTKETGIHRGTRKHIGKTTNEKIQQIAPKTAKKQGLVDENVVNSPNEIKEQISKLETKKKRAGKDTVLYEKYQKQIDELRSKETQQNHIADDSNMVKTAEKVEQTNKIDDVGEFLKGNRKKDTSLSWSDLESMNDLVRAKNMTKAKIYPKPTLEELKTEGYSDFGASLIINIYNKINSKPASRYTSKENQKLYVDMVNDTMKTVKEYIKNNPEKFSNEAMLNIAKETKYYRYQSDKSLFDTVFPDKENKSNGRIFTTYPEYNKKALIVGGTKFTNALYLDYSTLNDVAKILNKAKEEKAEKETGKTKKENWEKYFEIKEPTSWKNEYSVYFKNNDSYITSFKTKEEAETAVKRFFEAQEKVKERLNNINFVREYKERREQGKNITSDELKDTFGFRGVNFGNWVDQKKRQDFINYAYDSLLDLAELLNLPPKAISLNGELGLAFGAQGRGGKTAGHYIPDYKEINLTKERGAGTLAHEWWHALDNYFGNKSTNKEYSTNYGISLTDKGELREELFETLKNLREQIKNAPFTEEDIKNRTEHLRKTTIDRIETWAKSIKNTFSKEKNVEEINKFIDEIVDNKEKYKSYSIEDFSRLEEEFFKLVPKRRDTLNNRGSFATFSYFIRQLATIEDTARKGAKSTEYYRNAKLLDKQESKNTIYWSKDTELGARAFTSYLLDKMEQQNFINQFLVRPQNGEVSLNLSKFKQIAENEDIQEAIETYIPWNPTNAEEKTRIFKAFDDLFNTVKTRETDKGVELYSLSKDVDIPKFLQNYNDERKDYKFFLKNKEIVYDGRKVATLGELRKHKSFELVNDLFDPKDDNIEIKLLEKGEVDKMKAKGYKVLAYFNANTNAIYVSEDFTIGSIVHEYTHLLDYRTNKNNIFFRIENFLYRRLRNQQPKNEQEKAKQFESYKSFISERYAFANEQTANERLLNNDKRGQFRLPTKRTPTFMGKISELEWGRRRLRNNVGNGKGISKTPKSETTTSNGSIRQTTSRNDTRTDRGINNNNFYSLDNSDIKAHIPDDIDEILPKVKPPKDNIIDRVGGVISTRAGIINPKIKHALRRFEFDSGMNENKYAEDVKDFITKLDFMTPSDYAKYDLALKNGNKEVITALNSKYNLGKDYTKVRNVLANIRDEALNVGMNVGYIDEYFPRKVINASAILDEYSKDTFLKKMLREVDPNNVLSDEDKIEKINIALKGYNGAITASSSFIKGRKIAEITKELNRYYKDSKSSLIDYITSMNNAIETRKFFGSENAEVKQLRSTLRRKMNSLAELRKKTPYEAKRNEIGKTQYKLSAINVQVVVFISLSLIKMEI